LFGEETVFDCSDTELIFLARQGDKAAFSRLVLRYQPMAQRIARQAIGNEDSARDIVQDAMLQAYLSLAKLNDPTRFKSWLYGIVLNLCRDYLRRRQKVIYLSLETMVENLVDEHHSIDRSTLDPQLIAEQEELHAAILDAVDSLSDKNRLATMLFYHEQLSLQEVADRLNISVGAVKGRLHKARHQLRSILSPLEFPIQPTLVQELSTMTTSNSTSAEPEIRCSFCHKSKEKVELLIAGPLLMSARLYICNECVVICQDIIEAQVDRQNLI
jgi:RNA polymerase sigma-70 factor, ECF subfamily